MGLLEVQDEVRELQEELSLLQRRLELQSEYSALLNSRLTVVDNQLLEKHEELAKVTADFAEYKNLKSKDFERSESSKSQENEFLVAVNERGIGYAIETMVGLFDWLPNKDHDNFIQHSFENDFTAVSDCCNVTITQTDICSGCNEHCSTVFI